MLFLDLDLDFFLNDNAYGGENARLGPEYRPWPVSRVRHFLGDRCGLSPESPVAGRTVTSHDEIIDFWRTLIESGRLKVPFEVIHVDAHPDLWAGGGLYRTSSYLYLEPGKRLAMLQTQEVNPGNYLTFAIAYGWIKSLIWVSLLRSSPRRPTWDADARSLSARLEEENAGSAANKDNGVFYRVLPWHEFRAGAAFDYMALSKSPGFTPPASDALVPVIEGYMRQI
ncbi:MAG: UPF0489 family protein [Dehalococcoidales bacterium]|jgi:hypothetical protein